MGTFLTQLSELLRLLFYPIGIIAYLLLMYIYGPQALARFFPKFKNRFFPLWGNSLYPERKKIVIIVDKEKHSRKCFWKDLAKNDPILRRSAKITFLSIHDELEANKNIAGTLFDKDKCDAIIINWDAINGDPVYGSHSALTFFDHYRPDMQEWLKKGGKLILESQGASWGAAQYAYDVFGQLFDGPIPLVENELHKTGYAVRLNMENSRHFAISKLTDDDLVLDQNSLFSKKRWFPHDLHIPSLREIPKDPGKVYRGWFNEYEGWEPLILASENNKPVMICRNINDEHLAGHCILSTMFIASSEFTQLIGELILRYP